MTTKKHETHSINVRFARIAWFRDLNKARPSGYYGSDKELESLRRGLAEEGWWPDVNGVIEAEAISPERVKIALEERQRQWDNLKIESQSNADRLIDLKVYEELFVENGKLVKPEYIGITGNRRASQFYLAMVLRRRMIMERGKMAPEEKAQAEKELSLEPVLPDTIGVIVGDYSDPQVRLEAQVRENEGKRKYFLGSSPLDQLLFARELLSMGSNQSRLRRVFTSATLGVKYYFICLLDARFPNVKIIDRCKLPPVDSEGKPTPGYIHIPSVRQEDLQSMGQRLSAEETDAYNRKLLAKGLPARPPVTEQEVMDYFADPKTAQTNGTQQAKVMDRNAIKGIGDVHPNPLVAETAKAVYSNNGDPLKKFIAIADACKALLTLEEQGDYPFAEKLLIALAKAAKGKERNELEAKLMKAAGIK